MLCGDIIVCTSEPGFCGAHRGAGEIQFRTVNHPSPGLNDHGRCCQLRLRDSTSGRPNHWLALLQGQGGGGRWVYYSATGKVLPPWGEQRTPGCY